MRQQERIFRMPQLGICTRRTNSLSLSSSALDVIKAVSLVWVAARAFAIPAARIFGSQPAGDAEREERHHGNP